jgi:hypothetical protein
VAAVTVVIGAALLGAFGVHTRTTHATGGGYDLSVTYARTARAGLDIPWSVRVHHTGGFDKELTLAMTTHYFDIVETQGWTPEPTEETNDGSLTYRTFTAPPGDTFEVTLDSYIQPSSQLGRSGHVSLMLNGTPVVTAHFSTWLAP